MTPIRRQQWDDSDNSDEMTEMRWQHRVACTGSRQMVNWPSYFSFNGQSLNVDGQFFGPFFSWIFFVEIFTAIVILASDLFDRSPLKHSYFKPTKSFDDKFSFTSFSFWCFSIRNWLRLWLINQWPIWLFVNYLNGQRPRVDGQLSIDDHYMQHCSNKMIWQQWDPSDEMTAIRWQQETITAMTAMRWDDIPLVRRPIALYLQRHMSWMSKS